MFGITIVDQPFEKPDRLWHVKCPRFRVEMKEGRWIGIVAGASSGSDQWSFDLTDALQQAYHGELELQEQLRDDIRNSMQKEIDELQARVRHLETFALAK